MEDKGSIHSSRRPPSGERGVAPVRIDERGDLVVSIRDGWPDLEEARETLERYLAENAVAATGGNVSAAARLIGLTPYRMLCLRRLLRGEPARAGQGSEGGVKRRRGRPRGTTRVELEPPAIPRVPQPLTPLERLDTGRYREAIELVENGAAGTDAVGRLLRAEVALYLNKLGDAREELDGYAALLRVSRRGAAAHEARALLIASEIAYFRGEYDQAQELASKALDVARRTGDLAGRLRALYDLGRIARRRNLYGEGMRWLADAEVIAREAVNPFYLGLIAYNQANCAYHLGQLENAERLCGEAIYLLGASEGLRYEALARSFFAFYLSDCRRYAQAIAEYDRAEATAASLNIAEDILIARTGRARALLLQGRSDGAGQALEELILWLRNTEQPLFEVQALELLSLTCYAQGRFEEAGNVAAEASRLAETSHHEELAVDGRLLEARARARMGNSAGVEALERLCRELDVDGTEWRRAEVRIYLAEALARSEPDVAARLCREARGLRVSTSSDFLLEPLERVERFLRGEQVRREGPFTLTIDASVGPPKYTRAIQALTGFLLEISGAFAPNGESQAARELGITRFMLRRLKAKFEAEPTEAAPPGSR